MINIAELRIGSLIHYAKNHEWDKDSDSFKQNMEVITVDTIQKDHNFNRIGFRSGGTAVISGVGNFHPIGLTVKWLNEFGFNQVRHFDNWKQYEKIPKNSLPIMVRLELETGRFKMMREVPNVFINTIYIESIHQLQMLYFALTNEELEYDHKQIEL